MPERGRAPGLCSIPHRRAHRYGRRRAADPSGWCSPACRRASGATRPRLSCPALASADDASSRTITASRPRLCVQAVTSRRSRAYVPRDLATTCGYRGSPTPAPGRKADTERASCAARREPSAEPVEIEHGPFRRPRRAIDQHGLPRPGVPTTRTTTDASERPVSTSRLRFPQMSCSRRRPISPTTGEIRCSAPRGCTSHDHRIRAASPTGLECECSDGVHH